MARDIRTAIEKSRTTLLGDAVGAVCLVVTLYVGLSLPQLF